MERRRLGSLDYFDGRGGCVGARLARLLEEASIQRLDDFGGVCETFLCQGEEYLASPPRTASGAAVFSFTPKKRVLTEASQMARAARAAGYSLMILTMQKDGKFGKVWVLRPVLRHFTGGRLTYYEDTNSIIDDLKSSPEGANILAVHVLTPEFSHLTSHHADRVVSQLRYQQEVLL